MSQLLRVSAHNLLIRHHNLPTDSSRATDSAADVQCLSRHCPQVGSAHRLPWRSLPHPLFCLNATTSFPPRLHIFTMYVYSTLEAQHIVVPRILLCKGGLQGGSENFPQGAEPDGVGYKSPSAGPGVKLLYRA